jgi:hypothetical protein
LFGFFALPPPQQHQPPQYCQFTITYPHNICQVPNTVIHTHSLTVLYWVFHNFHRFFHSFHRVFIPTW